ncbi:nicotinamide mononucleotide transporter [Bacillus sp. BRMEA1]|uniref:nicotinamide riboside transporter PnuC n=1 Tax=Neobacillus endophyticus TaxID=2738405 RepID=UPI00156524F3|nr:nicotinamide riboside transporter PnuC [Neobacillus endophyticus]NRD79810.1 nicotinamide mononucleotide transporter [Neobacillus endophyticus]
MKNNLINYAILVIFVAIAYYKDSTFIEVLASFFGLVCVYLATKENIWNYPFGIINITLLLLIFYNAKLYADMMIQGMFLVLNFYGWVFWLRNRGEKPVCQTTKLTLDGWILTIFITPILSYGWGYLLNRFTDTSVPFLYSFIAATSLVAQVLFATKKFENWYLWILVNISSVGLYAYKGLYTISFTYFIFLIVSIVGVFEWKKQY